MTGRAWRLPLPSSWRGLPINTLEFIATIIALEIEFHCNPPSPGECSLISCDNVSAMEWLRKSNFDSTASATNFALARHTAQLVLRARHCLYSQWIAGKENNVADALSRDFHLSDKDLTQHLFSTYPLQVPPGFKICPVPSRVLSRLYSTVRMTLLPIVTPSAPSSAITCTGRGTLLSSTLSASTATTSSSASQQTTASPSLPPSCNTSEAGGTAQAQSIALCHQQRARRTLLAWRRPLPPPASTIPDSSWADELRAFYSCRQKATLTPTPLNSSASASQ